MRCLSSLVRDGEPAVVLHGPSGIGKSMLLRVLSERLEGERRVACVSVTDAPAPELCHLILDQLAEPATEDPAEALIRAASAAIEGHPRLLLLVDHADLAPIASSLQLVDAANRAAPHITLVFAVADGAGAQEFARALAAEARVTTLSFNQSMDSKEATAYVRLRMARAEIPAELRDQLDARTMRWLSEGAQASVPREINRRASELLRTYEQEGEAALENPLGPTEPEQVKPRDGDPLEPRAVDPATHGNHDNIEPNPPSFPIAPVSDPVPTGLGSLGGTLLGSGQGPKPNFELDLELGRSLSSGLLDSATPKQSSKDGQPVEDLPEAEDRGHAWPGPVAGEADESATRGPRTLVATASLIAFAIGSTYIATRESSVGEDGADVNSSAVVIDAIGALPAPGEHWTDTIAKVDESQSPSSASENQPANDTQRPTLVEGPMHDSVVNAIEAREKSQIAVVPVPKKPVAPPRPRVQTTPPKPAPKSTIVLPSRGIGTESEQANSYVRLSIDVEPGSEIRVDGESIGFAPFSDIFVEMGPHTFVAEMPDGILIEQLIDVQTGTDVVEF